MCDTGSAGLSGLRTGSRQVKRKLAIGRFRLAGEWVRELKRACGLARAEHGHVILDFADVVFVDRTRAALVQSLLHEGMSLINCLYRAVKATITDKDVESGKS
jgi:hypothetical protein